MLHNDRPIASLLIPSLCDADVVVTNTKFVLVSLFWKQETLTQCAEWSQFAMDYYFR